MRVEWGVRRSQRCKGELGSQLLRPEVILVILDCALCGVGVMKVWGNELELNSGITKKSFEAAGAFIVEHLELGSESAVREVGVKDASISDEFAFVARGEWLC